MNEAEAVTKSVVEQIPIDRIVVGVRRRTKLKAIGSLARSIRLHGLIHPILVRNGNTLVAGQRRLEACKRLNWETITARHVDDLSDAELRLIELDENAEREDLADFETSKARFAEMRQAEAKLKAQAARASFGATSAKTPSKRGRKGEGRPKKAASKRAIAEETGIEKDTQRRIERHVELAELYPFLKRPDWVRHNVLQAGDWIEQLNGDDQNASAALLDQDAIPPTQAINILKNLVEMPAENRAEIFTKARSDDPFERRVALTACREATTAAR
jgi:ParB family chromosome partitioning protein